MITNLQSQQKVKCYSSNAALCAEATVMQIEPHTIATVNLEITRRLHDSKKYDWDNKIIIQLSDAELPILCGLFMGYINEVSFKRNTKGFEFKRQPKKIYLQATSGAGSMCTMPISIGDTFRLNALFLHQLKKQANMSDETLLLAALRGVMQLYH